MATIDRRRFLGASAGAAAALASLGRSPAADMGAAASADVVPPPPVVSLGKTGIRLTRLAQGTGVHGGNRQSDQTRSGFARLHRAISPCVRPRHRFSISPTSTARTSYFPRGAADDSARRRHDSHEDLVAIRWAGRRGVDEPAIAGRRLPGNARTFSPRNRHRPARRRALALLHVADLGSRPRSRIATCLSEAKEKKQIGVVGVSCHTFEALKTAVAVALGRSDPRTDQPEARRWTPRPTK